MATYNEDELRLNIYISNLFLRINGNAIMSGYSYAMTAVKFVLKEGLVSMMSDVYPYVAKVHNTTPSRVERNIRHFVKTIWIRERVVEINRVFGANVYDKNNKPTNTEFICLVAEKAATNYAFINGICKSLYPNPRPDPTN